MRSPQSNAMEPRAGAGWPSSASAAAIRGADKATTRYREDLIQVNDSKNMILAVVLSALVLIGWTWASSRWFPAANPPSSKVEGGKQKPLQQPSSQPAGPASPKQLQSVSAALQAGPRVAIRTESLQGSINLKGAQIDDLV